MEWTWSSLVQFSSSGMPEDHKHLHISRRWVAALQYCSCQWRILPSANSLPSPRPSSQELDTVRNLHSNIVLPKTYSTPKSPQVTPPWTPSTNCWKQQQSKNWHRWNSCSVLWKWRNKPGQNGAQHPDLISVFMDPIPQENTRRSSMVDTCTMPVYFDSLMVKEKALRF